MNGNQPTSGIDQNPDDDPRRGHLHDIRLVAEREVRTRSRTTSFLISTGLSLAVIIAIGALPGLLRDDGPDTFDIGLVGEAEALAEPLRRLDAADSDIELEIRTVNGRDEADRLIDDGDLDVAVADSTAVVERTVPQALAPLLDAAVRAQRLDTAVGSGDVDKALATRLTDPQPLKIETRHKTDSDAERRTDLMRVGSFLLYAQIMTFSMFVANGVVEEKSSRVVEVLMARLRPVDLLAGKVIGVGLLGLSQLIVFVSVGLTAASLSGTIDLPPGWQGAMAEVFAWFLLGYTFYSCAYAVSGSLVSRQEELQNTSAPLVILLIVSFALSFGVADEPNGTVAVVASILPFSAPLVMPSRAAAGGVAIWQMVAAVAVTGLSAAGMVMVAARIYAGGALKFGARVKLLDAWRGTSGGQPASSRVRRLLRFRGAE